MFPYLALALLSLTLIEPDGAVAQTQPAMTPEAVRMTMPVFGVKAQIEVRNLPPQAAEAAITAAFQEVHEIDLLARIPENVAPEDGPPALSIAALNAAAGGGPQPVDPRVAELLLRGLQFCIWSRGAFGPLGGELYRLWESDSRPAPPDVHAAVGTSECNRVRLNEATVSGPGAVAELTVGSRVDMRGLARGFAVDRAMAVLAEHGATNSWVEVGNVWRAQGGGQDGAGWPVTLPPMPGGSSDPLDELWLRDQALVILSVEPWGGGPFVPPIDQRTGVPASGVVTVVVVTEQAVDAEPLASTLFIFGHREGQMRLGTLQPRPAVYWLLGTGGNRPLEATYRWHSLHRMRRRR